MSFDLVRKEKEGTATKVKFDAYVKFAYFCKVYSEKDKGKENQLFAVAGFVKEESITTYPGYDVYLIDLLNLD